MRPAGGREHDVVVEMRAADADRNRAADVLQQATAAGYLTLEEFEAELGRVYTSRTYSELDEILAAVPGAPRPSSEWAPQPPPPPRAPQAPRPMRPSSAPRAPRSPWLASLPFAGFVRIFLCVLAVMAVVSILAHAWPLPLIIVGIILWRRCHGHGWRPGIERRRQAELV